MSAALPTALALAGTALTAITLFAPFRPPAHATKRNRAAPLSGEALVADEPDDAFVADAHEPSVTVSWTARVDPAATACDAHARAELADALGALQTPWARDILRYAGEVETEPSVRCAIAAALSVSSSQSLVT